MHVFHVKTVLRTIAISPYTKHCKHHLRKEKYTGALYYCNSASLCER